MNAFQNRSRLERELGRGGMATVYLAEDLKHDCPVALKVLAGQASGYKSVDVRSGAYNLGCSSLPSKRHEG
jgi:serine/threonine protein kinase